MLHLAGLAEVDQELPAAALTAAVDFPNDSHRIWLRADPVYLQPGLRTVTLFDARHFAIDATTAEQQVARLNAHFSSEDWSVATSVDGQRWYLRLNRPTDLNTVPVDEVSGADIEASLPSGPDQSYWRGIMTEAQMLLHDAMAAGPGINAIWLWGGAQLSAAGAIPWSTLIGADPLLAGLASRFNIVYRADIDDLSMNGDALIVATLLRTVGTECDHLDALLSIERRYIMPLLAQVKKGDQLILLGDDACYRLNRWAWWRVWRTR